MSFGFGGQQAGPQAELGPELPEISTSVCCARFLPLLSVFFFVTNIAGL